VHARTEIFDLYVTVMRRKYIPPLMEVFQDIICISKFDFSEEIDEDDNGATSKNFVNLSRQYLQLVHQQAADSLYSSSRFTIMYKNIIDEKTNALLMDEDTIDYNQYNLNVLPSPGITYAVNYLESILTILGKYNPDTCKDLRR
jgi:hypothetical protein